MYDIAIIGAGPAGATLARLLEPSYRVLLLDKRDLLDENENNSMSKCCGGLLAPDAQYMIAKLGLGIPIDILVDPQLFTVRTIDLNQKLERYYQRYYFNMDREKYDRWLVSIIPENVDMRFNCRFKSLKKMSDGYEIEFSRDKKIYAEKTRVVVGADGAASTIRKMAFANKAQPQQYISIQEWFSCPAEHPYYTAIFDREITDFYAWTIPKRDYLMVGAALAPGNYANDKFELLKKRLQEYGFDFSTRIKREGAYIYRPGSVNQVFPGDGNVALVGEAAGAVSPSSAEGFSYAFRSALYLAQSLEPGIDHFMMRYSKKMIKLKVNIVLKNLKSPAMYNPMLRKLAMKSGLLSMKIE